MLQDQFLRERSILHHATMLVAIEAKKGEMVLMRSLRRRLVSGIQRNVWRGRHETIAPVVDKALMNQIRVCFPSSRCEVPSMGESAVMDLMVILKELRLHSSRVGMQRGLVFN